jgi:hypothetical protein
MWHHVYPSWHKTAQRCFFFIAVILLITLPVVYGKHHSISSKVLGSVLGVFFAIWIAFSVRLLILFYSVCPARPGSLVLPGAQRGITNNTNHH